MIGSGNALPLQRLIYNEIGCLLRSEEALLEILLVMQRRAEDKLLKNILNSHFKDKMTHIQLLQSLPDMIVYQKQEVKIPGGMTSLIRKADLLMQRIKRSGAARDVIIIMQLQKMIHYKIAGYRCMFNLLHHNPAIASVMKTILDHEVEIDLALTAVASESVNHKAVEPEQAELHTHRSWRFNDESNQYGIYSSFF